MKDDPTQELELTLLLDAVKQRYGYEFDQYARPSLMRRVRRHMQAVGVQEISELIPLFIHDKAAAGRFSDDLSVAVTNMFRDPSFFLTLRQVIIPRLKTYPFIKIWHAGCATGEEAYSMAILLEEEGLLERCQIYATDFNEDALEQAGQGRYKAVDMALYESNYLAAGGKKQLGRYCQPQGDWLTLDEHLVKPIVFANHNLVTDGVFGEMHLVLCRNVLIYFNQDLQNRVLGLLVDSLASQGVLCIGPKENIHFSPVKEHLQSIDASQRIYKKKT